MIHQGSSAATTSTGPVSHSCSSYPSMVHHRRNLSTQPAAACYRISMESWTAQPNLFLRPQCQTTPIAVPHPCPYNDVFRHTQTQRLSPSLQPLLRDYVSTGYLTSTLGRTNAAPRADRIHFPSVKKQKLVAAVKPRATEIS